MTIRKNFPLYTLLLLFLLSACSLFRSTDDEVDSLQPDSSLKASKVEPGLRAQFSKAEKALQAKNYEQAAKLYGSIKQKNPKGQGGLLSSYRLGTIYYFWQEYQAASREFEIFLTLSPNHDLVFDVTYNWAASEYQQRNYNKASSILSRLSSTQIDAEGPRRAEIVYQLVTRTYEAMGNPTAAIIAYASLIQLSNSDQTRTLYEAKVEGHLQTIKNKVVLEGLISAITEPLTLTLIQTRSHALVAEESEGPLIPVTAPVTTALPQASQAERTRVGVILPLSGRFASYGRRALDGLLLAARVFQPSRESPIQLFIHDSTSSPVVAEAAVDELFENEGAVAIIGPLNWRESVAVAERAEQLGIVNFSLGTKEGISGRGKFLFQNALTARIQLENLLQFAVQGRQLRRLAILAPDSTYGRDMSEQFWDLAEKMGAKIVAHEFYPEGAKDFIPQIQEMVGLAKPHLRKLELAKATEYMNTLPKRKIPRRAKEPQPKLPPLIDFDGLFIPDGPKAITQIAPSLAYLDVEKITLLGTTEWNTEQLYKRGGKSLEGAIFPGGIHVGTKNPRQKEFIDYYLSAYGTMPDLLSAQSYEAMELMGIALSRMSSNDRSEVANQFISFREIETPLGLASFDATRLVQRKLPIFVLSAGGSIEEF